MTTEPRIGKEFYDSGDYFEEGTDHLVDTESRFQRYRVRKVLSIHDPRPTDRVVDLGCGWGTFGFELADRVGQIVGIDFSAKSIEICNRRLESDPRENLRFICADGGETGLEGAAYDVVIAADLFEHLYPDDSERVSKEAYRLLRPGAWALSRNTDTVPTAALAKAVPCEPNRATASRLERLQRFPVRR